MKSKNPGIIDWIITLFILVGLVSSCRPRQERVIRFLDDFKNPVNSTISDSNWREVLLEKINQTSQENRARGFLELGKLN